jgi:acyl-coenzyme A synthetase/AMP-(fatty) acid ligase/acetyltransferase-like isoleucine patch superfamily enzyme/acyl carrier protein
MVKFIVKVVLQFFFWKPKKWRKGLKARLESSLYSIAIRRRAKSCGRNLYILGPGVNVTSNTVVSDGVGFGKDVKIYGDGPVFIGRRAVLAEDTLVYTQVHDYDHSEVLPFGWGFTYPETRIDDYAWLGVKCIVLPGAHVGEGAVVQAGSVVMGVIPPCAIAAGNPAKVIGWRDVEHYNRLKVAAGGKPVEIPGLGKSSARPVSRVASPAAAADPRLADIFCGVFSVTPEEAVAMKYKEHPAWDSAGQMALVSAIEREYGRALSPGEIYRLRSFADALDILAQGRGGDESRRMTGGSGVSPLHGRVFDLGRDGTAVVDEGREVSYRELAALSADAVKGLKPQTVKVVVNGQDLATVATFVGCVNSGVVPLMVPATMDPALLARLRSMYEGKPTSPDLALLLTTSGSTGSPKLVRISRANLRADNEMSERLFSLDAATRMTMILPICYAWGLSVACAVLKAGGALVMTRRTVMDAELADVMLAAGATHLAGVPYMYEVLDRFRFFERKFPALRGLLVSGGALAPALRRKFAEEAKARGISFSEGYGQTETTGVMSTIRTDLLPERIGSIGRAGEGGRFRIDDGELVYEGPIVAMGYAVCAEDLLKGDEWKGVRRTGDLASIDAEGYVTLSGRASRFLKIFGNRVSLDEVENLVKDGFPGAGCAATGADGDLRVFVASAAPEEVERFLVAKLHFNATVMKVRAVDAIPLNANGKTDYPKLKAAWGPA